MSAHDREHPGEGETAVVKPARADQWVRHKKRGTMYRVLGEGFLQATAPLPDEAALVIYQGDDGKIWARSPFEFYDGRFEEIPPALHPGATGESVVVPSASTNGLICPSTEMRNMPDPDPETHDEDAVMDEVENFSRVYGHRLPGVKMRGVVVDEHFTALPVAPPSQPGAGGEMRNPYAADDLWRRHPANFSPSPSSGDRAEGSAVTHLDALDACLAANRFIDGVAATLPAPGPQPGREIVEHPLAGGGVRVLWDGYRVRAHAVVFRDTLNRAVVLTVDHALPARDEAAALASSGGGEEVVKALRRVAFALSERQRGNVVRWEADALDEARAALSPPPPVAASEGVRGEGEGQERIARALCSALEIDPDEKVQGITGHWWKSWEQVAIHRLPKFLAALTPPGAGQRSAEGEG